LGKVLSQPIVDIAISRVSIAAAIASDFIGSHAKKEKTRFFAKQA
jgi:hypothetical protein